MNIAKKSVFASIAFNEVVTASDLPSTGSYYMPSNKAGNEGGDANTLEDALSLSYDFGFSNFDFNSYSFSYNFSYYTPTYYNTYDYKNNDLYSDYDDLVGVNYGWFFTILLIVPICVCL